MTKNQKNLYILYYRKDNHTMLEKDESDHNLIESVIDSMQELKRIIDKRERLQKLFNSNEDVSNLISRMKTRYEGSEIVPELNSILSSLKVNDFKKIKDSINKVLEYANSSEFSLTDLIRTKEYIYIEKWAAERINLNNS